MSLQIHFFLQVIYSKLRTFFNLSYLRKGNWIWTPRAQRYEMLLQFNGVYLTKFHVSVLSIGKLMHSFKEWVCLCGRSTALKNLIYFYTLFYHVAKYVSCMKEKQGNELFFSGCSGGWSTTVSTKYVFQSCYKVWRIKTHVQRKHKHD
jgi:hypothetical protein